MPSFNLKGERVVKTTIGGALTVTIFFILLLFTTNRLIDMFERKFPFVQDLSLEDYFPISL